MVLRAAILSVSLVSASGLGATAQTAEPISEAADETVAVTADEPADASLDEVDPAQPISDTVIDLAARVIASGDNLGLPFAIVDKAAAQFLVFGGDGRVQGLAPALIGSAVGDHSAPGVGDRELKDIPAKDRTTPAGRFLGAYGRAAGGETVLWVDYETAVSIHPTPDTDISRKEKRKERLASPTPEDNRITHGCINVSPAFYAKVVNPAFKKGGVFYILPEASSLKTAFPDFDLPGRIVASVEEDKPTKTSSR